MTECIKNEELKVITERKLIKKTAINVFRLFDSLSFANFIAPSIKKLKK